MSFRMQATVVAAAIGIGVMGAGALSTAVGEKSASTARTGNAVVAVDAMLGELRRADTRPVVFVHGLNADPGVWSSMETTEPGAATPGSTGRRAGT